MQGTKEGGGKERGRERRRGGRISGNHNYRLVLITAQVLGVGAVRYLRWRKEDG